MYLNISFEQMSFIEAFFNFKPDFFMAQSYTVIAQKPICQCQTGVLRRLTVATYFCVF